MVGYLHSKFGHARPLGSRIICHVHDRQIDRRTDKSNTYCPLLYSRGYNSRVWRALFFCDVVVTCGNNKMARVSRHLVLSLVIVRLISQINGIISSSSRRVHQLMTCLHQKWSPSNELVIDDVWACWTCVDADEWTAEDVCMFDGARLIHDQSCLRAIPLPRGTDAWHHAAVSMFTLRWIFIVRARTVFSSIWLGQFLFLYYKRNASMRFVLY